MIQRDHRYELIPAMLEARRVQSFLDIFKFIPRTVVARDLGMKVARLSARLRHLENFTLAEIFIIGDFCGLSRLKILELIKAEFALRGER